MSRRRQRGSMRARLLEDLRGESERYGVIDLEALAPDADRRGDQAYAAYVRACARACARKATDRKPGAGVDLWDSELRGSTLNSQSEVPQSTGGLEVRSAQRP